MLKTMGKGIVEDFLEYHEKSFCKAYFRTEPKCDTVDNNMSETFNGWILHARVLPIIAMLEEIMTMVMTRIGVKKNYAEKWKTDIAPRVVKQLEVNKQDSFNWRVLSNGDDEFQIIQGKNKHVVKLGTQTCTCRSW